VKVLFPDGMKVQARGGLAGIIPHADHEKPDWALYLDDQWRQREVEWPCEVIDWPDFELPPDEKELFEAILGARERASSGQVIEIACDGGTGRTGTVVACLAVLSGVPVGEAVDWTREHYHRWAVEVPKQEAMISSFAAWAGERGLIAGSVADSKIDSQTSG
jgi:protein-tyrosine phosphatase